MKSIFISAAFFTAIAFTACNSNKSEHEGHTAEAATTDTATHAATPADADIATLTPTFTSVDPAVSAAIKEIVDNYLRIKNALVNDNSSDAAKAGEAMAAAIRKVDKSLLTAEQKKLFDENQEDLLENAEHTGENASNIKHQREHFAVMSEEVYALAKGFGGGQTLYHDHCPMYNDNKGGMWLSETKEIKNPYFGASMSTCGKVQEMIQ